MGKLTWREIHCRRLFGHCDRGTRNWLSADQMNQRQCRYLDGDDQRNRSDVSSMWITEWVETADNKVDEAWL